MGAAPTQILGLSDQRDAPAHDGGLTDSAPTMREGHPPWGWPVLVAALSAPASDSIRDLPHEFVIAREVASGWEEASPDKRGGPSDLSGVVGWPKGAMFVVVAQGGTLGHHSIVGLTGHTTQHRGEPEE